MFRHIALLFSISTCAYLLSCTQCEIDSSLDVGDQLVLPMTTTDTILYVTVNGDQVPVYISIPTDCPQKALPAVVLLHGSGGMWQDDDRDAGVMSRQNREWRALFDANCFVGVYIDSYTPSGFVVV
jgi:poly(3-hydroxybutyrate) depolymerase